MNPINQAVELLKNIEELTYNDDLRWASNEIGDKAKEALTILQDLQKPRGGAEFVAEWRNRWATNHLWPDELADLAQRFDTALAGRGTGWASVEERLPEVSTPEEIKWVWGWYSMGDGFPFEGGKVRLVRSGWRPEGSNSTCIVTHWQPLPNRPPPKEPNDA